VKNYYYILGVNVNSTEEEIKAAYRKLSLKLHPDTNNGEKFFENRFIDIQEAYQTLSNKSERRKYNRHLRDLEQNEETLLIEKQELTDRFEEMYREKEEELIRNYQLREEGLKNNGIWKKRKQHFAYAFLILISGMFVFGTVSRSKFSSRSADSLTDANPTKTVLINLIYEWNKAHNEKNCRAFFDLFDDSLMYYGKPTDSKRCIENKFLFFQKNPNLRRDIVEQIRVEKINDVTYKGSFLKRVETDIETKYYPSYLVLKKGKKGWRIIIEGDLVTDSNNSRQGTTLIAPGRISSSFECNGNEDAQNPRL
jgi:curved DNA-binding protein CbpA